MKVLHLLAMTNRGGAEMLTLDVCRNAKKNDLDLIVVSLGTGNLEMEFINSGVVYINLNRKMSLDVKVILKLRRIIKKYNIDIIHSHSIVAAIHAYFAIFLLNVKLIITHHGFTAYRKIQDESARKFLKPRVDLNIAVSKSYLEELNKGKHNRNFIVIYNGIDVKKFYTTKKEFRKELNLSDDDFLLGMIGNFYTGVRDQLTVCKSLPSVFKRFSNVHFVFVGGRSNEYPNFFDECYDYCKEKEILDRVHFIGVRPDINDILNSIDLFVYSSNYDSFGIAVIEALLEGVPVIINDLPPLLEVTNDGKYAEVFKSKSPEDLTDKIIKSIENFDIIKSSDEGKLWALSKFSIEQHIKNLIDTYKKLLCVA